MELVATVWPIVDGETGVVQRYLIKAYALAATDEEISTVLTILARSDYRTAHPVKLPDRYKMVFDQGTILGALPIGAFQQDVSTIIESELKNIEKTSAQIPNYGADIDGNARNPEPLKFPDNPYIVTTVLLESVTGELRPQL